MAKGLDKHRERLEALSKLGRPLARRSRSCCELCEDSGVSLTAWEVTPIQDEVSIDHTLFLCEPCITGIKGKLGNPSRWRFLSGAVWAELTATQVVAVRLLNQLAAADEAWASELLDDLYLDDETKAWVENNK